jgi:hypothetical protein
MATPQNDIAVTSPFGSLRASGPNLGWLLGFVVVAGAVIYSNYQIRTEIRQQIAQQTAEIHHALDAQTILFTAITNNIAQISAAERREVADACKGLVK